MSTSTENGNNKQVPEPHVPSNPGSRASLEEKLDHKKMTSEHVRSEQIKNGISTAGLWVLFFIVALIIGAIISLGFQYLSPWGWLSDDQLRDVKTFLTSGALISMAMALYRKYLD